MEETPVQIRALITLAALWSGFLLQENIMTNQDIKILWYLRDSNDVRFLKLVAETANALVELANTHQEIDNLKEKITQEDLRLMKEKHGDTKAI